MDRDIDNIISLTRRPISVKTDLDVYNNFYLLLILLISIFFCHDDITDRKLAKYAQKNYTKRYAAFARYYRYREEVPWSQK